MVKLLGKTLGRQQKNANGATDTAAPIEEQPRDRILVLVPGEGGFAFRLLAFISIEHAASYGFEHFPQRVHQLYSFRPHHQRPPDLPAGVSGQVEAVVMVRDEQRHGTVHLYSFVDMETAHAFVRAEGMRGLNLPLVLVFWAEPVALYNTVEPEAPPPEELSGPPPLVLTQWQQPKNPVFDSLQPESPAPVFADDAADAPPPAFDSPPAFLAASPPQPSGYTQPAPASAPPPPAPVAPLPQYASPPVNGTSFTTQPKEPRRWNASEDFPAPGAAPAAPAQQQRAAGAKGRAGAFIHRVRSWPGWDGFGPVMLGAALLRWQTYDEVRKDPHAAGRAWVLAGTSVGASAMSAAFFGPMAFFFFGLFAAIGAAVYAGLIHVLATQLFGGRPERDDNRLFFQRLGLAAAPGPLLILGIIPIYGPLFVLAVLIWIGATSIKAVEIGMEMERQPAAYTAIIAWLALFAVAFVLPTLAV